jgi:hypothetical protein
MADIEATPAPKEVPGAASVEKEVGASVLALQKDPIQNQFLPDDNEFTLAKQFLTTKMGTKHPVSVYDHITTIIMKTLEQRDKNVVGIYKLNRQFRTNVVEYQTADVCR